MLVTTVDFASALVLGVIVFFWCEEANFFHATVAFVCYYGFTVFLPKTFLLFPGMLTFGEGCLILQTVGVYVTHSLAYLFTSTETDDDAIVCIIEKTCLLSILFGHILASSRLLRFMRRRPFKALKFWILVASATLISYLFIAFKINRWPLTWFIGYVSQSQQSLSLFLIWFGCLAVGILSFRTTLRALHPLFAVAYCSGLILDINLLKLLSIAVLVMAFVPETCKRFELKVASKLIKFLEDFCQLMDDEPLEEDEDIALLERDKRNRNAEGTFGFVLWITGAILMPICSVQAKNVLDDPDVLILQLSGVLTLSIGLPSSAICNSMIKRKNYFPDSEKSVQGTVCSVLVQLAFIELVDRILSLWTVGHSTFICAKIACPVIVVSLIEAVCTQRQNLVMPPLLYTMMLIS